MIPAVYATDTSGKTSGAWEVRGTNVDVAMDKGQKGNHSKGAAGHLRTLRRERDWNVACEWSESRYRRTPLDIRQRFG